MVRLQGASQNRLAPTTVDFDLLMLSMAAVFFVEGAAGLLYAAGYGTRYVVIALSRGVEIAAILFIVYYRTGNLTAVGLSRRDIKPGLFRGFLWSAGFGIVVGIVFSGIYLAGKNPFLLFRTHLPDSTGKMFFFFFLGGWLAPFAEELFFRGIVYGCFRRWGIVAAVTGSTVLFVLLHFHSGIPFTQVVGGLLFAAAYEVEKKLMAPFLIHALGNTALFTIALFTGG